MPKFGNRVKETTTSVGAGTIALNGAVEGFRAFSQEFESGDLVYYVIVDDPGAPVNYEVGYGTFTSGTPDLLTRDVVEASSNNDTKVSWLDGPKTVVSVVTADALGREGPPKLSNDPTPQLGGTLDANGNNINMGDNQIIRAILLDSGEKVNLMGALGGGTKDINITLGNVVSATVTASTTTFTFSNPSPTGNACGFLLVLTNGGSQTVNWPASVKWPSGVKPPLTAAGIDVLVFFTLDAGSTWHGRIVIRNSS